MKYSGGMGNQMFQYAMMRKLMISNNEDALCDLSYYGNKGRGGRCFELQEAFPNAVLKIASEDEVKRIREKISSRPLYEKVLNRIRPANHTLMYERDDFKWNKRYLCFADGRVDGFWQNQDYFIDIKPVLLQEFKFDTGDHKSCYYDRIINSQGSIGIHMRFTDYSDAADAYGGICTAEYYEAAIEYIEKKAGRKCELYLFSDDINKAAELIGRKENVYCVEDKNVPNWYDMYLMTLCDHNIIANSTYSWWGAWLNESSEKIVVQPALWDRKHPKMGIHVPEWVTINEKGYHDR